MLSPIFNRLFSSCSSPAVDSSKQELEPARVQIEDMNTIRRRYEDEYKTDVHDLIMKALEQASQKGQMDCTAKVSNAKFQVTVTVPKSFDMSKLSSDFLDFNSKLYADARIKGDLKEHPQSEQSYNGTRFQLFLPNFSVVDDKNDEKKDSDDDIVKIDIKRESSMPSLIPIEDRV